MKKGYILISIFFVLSLYNCSADKDSNDKIAQLNQELVELKKEIKTEDSTVNYYVDYANNLHDNIDLITEKQKELLLKIKSDPTLLTNKDTSINNEIASIGLLIEQNNSELEKFKSNYKNATIRDNSLVKLIDNVTEGIEDKNESIVDLQVQLEAVDVAFEDLFSVFGETLAELDETKNSLNQTKSYLNTVWYVIDNKKSLEEKGVIAVAGGFIGIGTNEELKGSFDIHHFTKGNKTTLRKIALPESVKKLEIVTSHPQDSYKIQNGILEILNTNDFWSVSKYLVISTK